MEFNFLNNSRASGVFSYKATEQVVILKFMASSTNIHAIKSFQGLSEGGNATPAMHLAASGEITELLVLELCTPSSNNGSFIHHGVLKYEAAENSGTSKGSLFQNGSTFQLLSCFGFKNA